MSTHSHSVDLTALLSPVSADLERVRRRIGDVLSDAVWPVGDYLSQLDVGGGKMLRAALTLLSGQAVGSPGEKHIDLAALVELIHLASLLHDDVIDQAKTRRGCPSANIRWGNNQAVLLGDYLLSRPLASAETLNLAGAAKVMCQTAEAICTGEIRQNFCKGDLDLSESDYLQIIEAKTASLFGACCYLGAFAADDKSLASTYCRQYGIALGMAFQITDDLLDIVGCADKEGKTLGTDLFNEKLTLPVIYWLRQGDGPARQAEFLRFSERSDAPALAQAIRQSDAAAYTLSRAGDFIRQAKEALVPLPESVAKDALLGLATYVLLRATP